MWHGKVLILFLWFELESSYSFPKPELPKLSGNSLTKGKSPLKKIKNSLRIPRNDDNKPDFSVKYFDSNLESKLANMRLGNVVRSRRDENDAKKYVEKAEVKAAVAAVQAEEAKESALLAVKDTEKAEKGVESLQKKVASMETNRPSSPLNSKSNSLSNIGIGSRSKNKDSEEDLDGYAKEEYDDDETDTNEDDKEAEETIIDDNDAVTIKTTLIESEDDHERQNNKIETSANNNGGAGIGICQGLLDLKSMSDDFRQRLQTLIDREEQAVEKLEQLQSELLQTIQKASLAGARTSTGGMDSDGNVQPSKACVYIQENIETGADTRSRSNTDMKRFQSTLQDQNENKDGDKIHIFTSQGVLPNPIQPQPPTGQQHQFSNQNQVPLLQAHLRAPPQNENNLQNSANVNPSLENERQQHQFSNKVPLLVGHLNAPHQNENNVQNSANFNPSLQNVAGPNLNVNQNSRFTMSRDTAAIKRKLRRQSGSSSTAFDEGVPEPEIDLENIYWVKTDKQIKQAAPEPEIEGKQNKNSFNGKLQSVLKEIQEDGLDLLIIPISSKFDDVKDVAKSFLSSMRAKSRRTEKDVKGRKVRFRMTVRRVK